MESAHQAWLTRIAIYFGVWCAADLFAFTVRFGAFEIPSWATWIWILAPAKLALLLLLVPRRSTRSDARGLLLAIVIATVGIVFVAFWSNAEFSRSLIALSLAFALVALLTTSAVLQRTALRRA
jgi:hypothetical protein